MARPCWASRLAVWAALAPAARGAPVMPLADVPLFRLRCRVEGVEGTSVAPASSFYVGQLGAPTTAVVGSSGTGWSGWTAFNATHANSTMTQYPNWAGHEALFGPYPMLVTRLIVSPHLPHVPARTPYFASVRCEWTIVPSHAHPQDSGTGTLRGRLLNKGGDVESFMGIILSRGAVGATPSLASFADFNQANYFSVMELFPERPIAKKMTINDGISGDDSYESHAWSHAGQERLGFNLLNDEEQWKNVSFETRIPRRINMAGPFVLGAHQRLNKTTLPAATTSCGPQVIPCPSPLHLTPQMPNQALPGRASRFARCTITRCRIRRMRCS